MAHGFGFGFSGCIFFLNLLLLADVVTVSQADS